LHPTHAHARAFSQTRLCRDEGDPDTVDAIASIGTTPKPKRTRKPKTDAGETTEGQGESKQGRPKKSQVTNEDGTEQKKPGRPKKTDETTGEEKATPEKKAAPKKKAATEGADEVTGETTDTPKKKAAPKKKKKAVAKKPVGRKKKPLSQEEKQKVRIKDLKAVALLDEPRNSILNNWNALVSETKGESFGGNSIGQHARELAEKYHSMSSSETEVCIIRTRSSK